MIKRVFSYDEQFVFAKITGDYNPVHLDKVFARRLLFGRVVVHGVHALLWGLDVWLEKQKQTLRISALKAKFLRGIGIDEDCFCSWNESENKIEITVMSSETVAIRVTLQFEPTLRESVEVHAGFPKREHCANHTTEDALKASGKVKLYLHRDLVKECFPNVFRILPSSQVAVILATTRVVGMKCPGLHSIFSALEISFNNKKDKSQYLKYEVSRFDDRFSLFSIKVKGPDMMGTVKAFARPAPESQESFAVISEKIQPKEFEGIKAIVIGGSRGIGEVTAKILAAGGAKVCITYSSGVDDARQTAQEINVGGGCVEYVHFDVLSDPRDMESELRFWIDADQLYYFATPFIGAAVKKTFSEQLFEKYCSYYVTGFNNTVYAILKAERTSRKIFYPSSIFVDTFPLNMGEYAAAKAAGEILCTFLEKANSGLVVYKPRLPMLSTDRQLL